ncbi:PRA1 family protein [Plasmodiophora brassicae]
MTAFDDGVDYERSRGESPERVPGFKRDPTMTPDLLLQVVFDRIRHIRLRDWNDFFMASRMRLPKQDVQVLKRRLLLNGVYFQANYVAFAALAACFVCIARPTFLIAVIIVIATAVHVFAQGTPHPTLVKALAGASPCLLLYVGGSTLISGIVLSLFVSAFHAVSRIPSSKQSTCKVSDLWRAEGSIVATLKGPPKKVFDEEDPEPERQESASAPKAKRV